MTGVPGNATVLDATVLSNFAHVDAVELLLELPQLVTVDEVAAELERGRDTHSYLDHAIAVLGDGTRWSLRHNQPERSSRSY